MITEISQYMTFKLGNELFAINVAQVREVLEVSTITRVPTAPDYMRGVVNVRGKAIPVVDLRLRFGLPPANVHEVIELDPSHIEPPPRIAMRWRTEFIQGLGQRGEDFIIVLDVNAVFTSEELALVGS
jgi:purine-binding chemotaxis protein CheW